MQTFKLSSKKSFYVKRVIGDSYYLFNVYYIFKCQYFHKLTSHDIRDERIDDYTNKMLYTDYENL